MMFERGACFHQFMSGSYSESSCQAHQPNGCYVEVHARISPEHGFEVFCGVYGSDGRLVGEEHHTGLDAELFSLDEAVAWARARAESLAAGVKN